MGLPKDKIERLAMAEAKELRDVLVRYSEGQRLQEVSLVDRIEIAGRALKLAGAYAGNDIDGTGVNIVNQFWQCQVRGCWSCVALNSRFPSHEGHRKVHLAVTDLWYRSACECGEVLKMSLAASVVQHEEA